MTTLGKEPLPARHVARDGIDRHHLVAGEGRRGASPWSTSPRASAPHGSAGHCRWRRSAPPPSRAPAPQRPRRNRGLGGGDRRAGPGNSGRTPARSGPAGIALVTHGLDDRPDPVRETGPRSASARCIRPLRASADRVARSWKAIGRSVTARALGRCGLFGSGQEDLEPDQPVEQPDGGRAAKDDVDHRHGRQVGGGSRCGSSCRSGLAASRCASRPGTGSPGTH